MGMPHGLGITLGVWVVARAVFAPASQRHWRSGRYADLHLFASDFVLLSFLSAWVADAFNGLPPLEDNLTVVGNLIYFSFVTLTSVGYGDIVPVHPFARGLANIEAIIGQRAADPATLLARLVTLELEQRRR